MIQKDFIKIDILENEIEAQLVSGILEEQGIAYRIDTFHDTAYDGLFVAQKGWGALYAPLEKQGIIVEILAQIRNPSSG